MRPIRDLLRGRKRNRDLSIRTRLILIFALSSTFALLVNVIFLNIIRHEISQIDEVYMSNVELKNLSADLDNTQAALQNYLETKSSDSLENYYRYSQDYSNGIREWSYGVTDDKSSLMRLNIANLTESYLSEAETAIAAKRSRRIELYKEAYQNAVDLSGYLGTFLDSLNNVQFEQNTKNYEQLYTIFLSMEQSAALLLVAVIALDFVMAVLMTRSITRPLNRLAEYAAEVGRGNFDTPPLPAETDDEVGTVIRAINSMVESIKGYIARVRESMEKERAFHEKELLMDTHLKEAELKYLQAQINPHFLFNTLNAGAQLAMLENADTTYKYLQNVAAFFRKKTDREKQVTTLADEIALVDSYVYIINVRFSGEIHYEKRIDDTLTRVSVPSMILQPIIENAINHGLRGISREGQIVLSVYAMKDDICISVRDNGVGMSREQIENAMAGKTVPRKKGEETNGVGLGNVIERLKLFYDRDDVCDIVSPGEGKGTEIILYIPKP